MSARAVTLQLPGNVRNERTVEQLERL